jgi:hypothetical protein
MGILQEKPIFLKREIQKLSKLRQIDQPMADAARIAFCHPGQAKREPGS